MPTAENRGKPDSASGSDPLTITIAGILALAAIASTVFCLTYAIWWLVTFWAPA
jgi:hypothetical protein